MPTFEYAPAPESRAVVDLQSSYGLFINGEFVDGNGAGFKSISPATEEVLAEVPDVWLEPVPGADAPDAVRAAYVAFLTARLGARQWLPVGASA